MWGDSRRDGERLRSLVPSGVGDDERTEQTTDRSRVGRDLFGQLRGAITAAAFWMAIPLPFLYVPVLLSGLKTQSEYLVFVGLVVTHVAVLSLGHPYATDRSDDRNRTAGADRGEAAD